jgi:hypothetical protein
VLPSAAVSTAPVIRIRAPVANSISIAPGPAKPADATSGAIRTDAKPIRGRTPNCRRQPYSWPGCIPASRATADTLAPGSSDADTNCCFSAELQRRRRSTEVMTSTRPFVM